MAKSLKRVSKTTKRNLNKTANKKMLRNRGGGLLNIFQGDTLDDLMKQHTELVLKTEELKNKIIEKANAELSSESTSVERRKLLNTILDGLRPNLNSNEVGSLKRSNAIKLPSPKMSGTEDEE